MPSQDDYTDGLLKDMGEEDIEKLLSQNREEGQKKDSPEEFQGDVTEMLNGNDDSDLQEIQDLLQKSDNNEAINADVTDNLQEAEAGNPAGLPEEDAEEPQEAQLTEKQKKAQERKKAKEEKAAAKRAAKEAAKQAKLEKKAAKTKKSEAPKEQEPEDASDDAQNDVDVDFLDSILSEANRVQKDSEEAAIEYTGKENSEEEKEPSEKELTENEKKEDTADVPQEPVSDAENAEEADDFGIDLSNLFADSGAAEEALLDGEADAAIANLTSGAQTGAEASRNEAAEDALPETAEAGEKPKKKGLFARLLSFLTEEDEEEAEENEEIKLSEENKEIIEDLDKEKGKKKKKEKKGKQKKGEAAQEGAEEGAEQPEQEKKGKKEKKKKEKKAKENEDAAAAAAVPEKKLGMKRVLPVLLICFSLGAAVIILTNVSVDATEKKEARAAYRNGDYQTCYQNLYGKTLNESDKVMFGKSESILRIRLWIREYEIFEAEGEQLEALDSLIQSIHTYPALYEYAAQWNAAGEVEESYATLLNLLYEKYGLTEEQALEIAAEPDDVEYTRMVYAVVQGEGYGSWNEPTEEQPLQDELPEETELPEITFIDNNTSAQ